MSNNSRKTKTSDPEQLSFATSKVISEQVGKTDEGCGSCPPPKQRCPNQAKKVTSLMAIPDSEIASSIGGPVSIDQIDIGTMIIPSLGLRDFKGDFTYASCKAKSVELEITLSISINFEADISIDWIPDPHASGGMDFAFTDKYSLGNIDFQPGSFSMKSPKMTMGPFSMTSEPIRETKVEEVTTEGIKMKCTSIPLESPLCTDLGICLPVQNPMCPNNVITEETNIERMDSKKISSRRVVMKDISALNIKIPSVTTEGFEAISTTKIKTSKPIPGMVNPRGDATRAYNTKGDFTLTITKVIMRVSGLEFRNVEGTVTTASAISDKLDMNLFLKGIKIKGLNLCGMKIPEIEVEF